jgi:hypothetical protein
VGLIFTKGDLKEVREEVAKYKVIDMPCLLHSRYGLVDFRGSFGTNDLYWMYLKLKFHHILTSIS